MEGWYWYAEDMKVPSLFDAVQAKGGKSPACRLAGHRRQPAITDNVPEYWRANTPRT